MPGVHGSLARNKESWILNAPRRCFRGRSDPHICLRCAGEGSTCCQLTPGQEELCFPLSEMERDRILDFSGEQGAFAQEANASQFVTNLKRLFPGERTLVERLFPSHGHHLRLATRPDGDCVFLGPTGCTLPRDARPYYCHLFPFWVYKRRFTLFTPEHCLAVQEGKGSVQLVEEVMNVRLSEIAMYHGRLRLAWGLPPSEDMPLLERSFARYDRTSKRKTAQTGTAKTGTGQPGTAQTRTGRAGANRSPR